MDYDELHAKLRTVPATCQEDVDMWAPVEEHMCITKEHDGYCYDEKVKHGNARNTRSEG